MTAKKRYHIVDEYVDPILFTPLLIVDDYKTKDSISMSYAQYEQVKDETFDTDS
jgi:hypothetical protein